MGLLDGLMGGQGGGQQGGMMGLLMGLLSQPGALQSILGQFQQGGLGHKADSWVSTGQNQPLEPHELEQVMGHGQLDQLAQQAGMSRQEASGGLAQMLPQIIDRLTPDGQVPQHAPQQNDLMGMLGGLLGGMGRR